MIAAAAMAVMALAAAGPGGGAYQKRVWGQFRKPPPGGWGVLWWQKLSVLDQIRTLPWHRATESEWVWGQTPERSSPSCMIVKRNMQPKVAAPDNSWIEVSHGKSPLGSERATARFYVALGSGVWVNTGKTAVYNQHSDAARDLLNVSCSDSGPGSKGPPASKCTPYYLRIFKALADRNYTSVQFLRHGDMPGGCVAAELVFLGVSGVSACPAGLEYRSGAEHERPCHCDDSLAYLNCGGQFVKDACDQNAAFRRLAFAGGVAVAVAVALVVRAKTSQSLDYEALPQSELLDANTLLVQHTD